MSSSSLLSNEARNKVQYNRLEAVKIKTNHLSIDNNFLDTDIPGLKYMGINMKPCQYCRHNEGIHYHNLNKNDNSIGYNYIDDKHMCEICKANPGKLHIHL